MKNLDQTLTRATIDLYQTVEKRYLPTPTKIHYVRVFPFVDPPHTRVLLSATLLDEWQVISRVFIQAGIRVDKYFDLEGIALSPRGAIVAKLYDGGITKLVVGRAFRAPTIYETTFSDGQTLVAPAAPRCTARRAPRAAARHASRTAPCNAPRCATSPT